MGRDVHGLSLPLTRPSHRLNPDSPTGPFRGARDQSSRPTRPGQCLERERNPQTRPRPVGVRQAQPAIQIADGWPIDRQRHAGSALTRDGEQQVPRYIGDSDHREIRGRCAVETFPAVGQLDPRTETVTRCGLLERLQRAAALFGVCMKTNPRRSWACSALVVIITGMSPTAALAAPRYFQCKVMVEKATITFQAVVDIPARTGSISGRSADGKSTFTNVGPMEIAPDYIGFEIRNSNFMAQGFAQHMGIATVAVISRTNLAFSFGLVPTMGEPKISRGTCTRLAPPRREF